MQFLQHSQDLWDNIMTYKKLSSIGVLLLLLNLSGCRGTAVSSEVAGELARKEVGQITPPSPTPRRQETLDQEELARDAAKSGYKVSRRQYANYEYGYTVTIPGDFVGVYNPSPAPQHGFSITLSKQPKAEIWVDGSYARITPIERNPLEGAVDDYLRWLREDRAAKELEVLSRESTALQNLPAARVLLRYKSDGSDEMVMQDIVFAVRTTRDAEINDDIQVLYVNGLSTSESRYSADREVFEQVVSNWRAKPLGR